MEMFSNLMVTNTNSNMNHPVNSFVQYYFAKDGQRIGPYSENDIARFISAGQINNQTYLWKTGMNDWAFAEHFLEFKINNI